MTTINILWNFCNNNQGTEFWFDFKRVSIFCKMIFMDNNTFYFQNTSPLSFSNILKKIYLSSWALMYHVLIGCLFFFKAGVWVLPSSTCDFLKTSSNFWVNFLNSSIFLIMGAKISANLISRVCFKFFFKF